MSYCVNCGAEVTTAGQELCDSCQAGEKETIAKKEELSPQYYVDLYKSMLLKPEEPLRNSINYKNVIPGAITVGLTALYFSLVTLIFAKRMLLAFGFFGGGLGSLFGMGYSFPYGEIFFKSLVIFLVQWPLFALSLFVVMKLFKYEISMIQSFNVTGLANFYLLVVGIAATILGFISPSIGMVIFLGGFFTAAFAVYKGIQSLLTPVNSLEVYLMPAVILVFLFAEGLFINIIA